MAIVQQSLMQAPTALPKAAAAAPTVAPSPPPPLQMAQSYAPAPTPPKPLVQPLAQGLMTNVAPSTVTPAANQMAAGLSASLPSPVAAPAAAPPPPTNGPAVAPAPAPAAPAPAPVAAPAPSPAPAAPSPQQNPWQGQGWGGGYRGPQQNYMQPQPMPQQPPAAPAAPQGSVEQQSLNGGGTDNKQQISNFMTALGQAGAGSNNQFANGGTPAAAAPTQPLVNMPGAQAPQQASTYQQQAPSQSPMVQQQLAQNFPMNGSNQMAPGLSSWLQANQNNPLNQIANQQMQQSNPGNGSNQMAPGLAASVYSPAPAQTSITPTNQTSSYVMSDAAAKEKAKAEGFKEGVTHGASLATDASGLQLPPGIAKTDPGTIRGNAFPAASGSGAYAPAPGAGPSFVPRVSATGQPIAPKPEVLARAPAATPGMFMQPYAPAGTPAAANPGNLPPARIAYLQQLAAQQPAGPPTPDPATLAASQAPQPLGNVPEETYGMGPGVTSDENEKNDFGDAKPALLDFMGQIGAHSYRYKDPSRDGEGTYTTPMAQELQKTDLGKQAVVKTPHGLGVDYQRLGGVNLAALSVVHRENQRLQSQIDEMRSSAGKGKR